MGGLLRRIEFEGSFNFRDLGGWQTDEGRTVRWRRLFRADSVHLLTPADVARARDELGVRTMLDLRNELEVEAGGVGLLADGTVHRRHFPITGGPSQAVVDGVAADSSDRSANALVAQYLRLLERSSALIVDAVDVLAGGDALPAVFFCAAGKDRTGILSAVILGALGVRDDDLVEDYVLTSESIERIIGRLGSTPGSPDMYRELPPMHFAPYEETMVRVIDDVRRTYGSFADYLLKKGLPSDSLEGLSERLLDG